MGFLINQYQGFSGNAVEMASVASQCAQFLQMPGDLDKINERLVRYYVAEGLVDRPKRVGRDAEYGYLHILQFLAGRFLVDAGFPMQKVAPYLASLDIPQLEALVMNKTKPNMAELLVASFASPQSRALREDEDQVLWNKSRSRTGASSKNALSGSSVRATRSSSGVSDSVRFETLSADLNVLASNLQPSPSDSQDMKSVERLDKLSDQINYLTDSLKHGLSDLLDRATDISTKDRQIVEEQLERMRHVLQDERAQWRDAMERERSERRNEYLEIREQINQLMAMMAEQSKGKEHD